MKRFYTEQEAKQIFEQNIGNAVYSNDTVDIRANRDTKNYKVYKVVLVGDSAVTYIADNLTSLKNAIDQSVGKVQWTKVQIMYANKKYNGDTQVGASAIGYTVLLMEITNALMLNGKPALIELKQHIR